MVDPVGQLSLTHIERETNMTKFALSVMTAAVLGLGSLQATAADGFNRRFDIVNESDATIVAVRASNIDNPNFGRDLLGNYVVRPGYKMNLLPVRDQGYCRFDVQITFGNGDVQRIWDVNLCEATEVVTYGYDLQRHAFYHKIIYG